MNENTTILLGAVAVIAIGVGAYVSMSSPANEGFTTQSFRKQYRNPVQYQPTSESDANIYGGDDDGGDISAKPIVKFNSDQSCSVTFDDGVTMQGKTSNVRKGGHCCDLSKNNHEGCYSGKEPGVSGVDFGTQRAEEKLINDNYESFSTQSTRKNTQKTISNTNIGINDNKDDEILGRITVKYNSDATCSVTSDDGVTRTGETDRYNHSYPCCLIKSHNVCYNGKEPGVSGVEYEDQPVEKLIQEEQYTR